MKIQKLILSAATAFLMVGASGAAMAVDCDGIIEDQIVQNVTVGAGATCIVIKSNVRGSFVATGASVVVLTGSNVDGQVLIEDSGVVAVEDNDLWDGSLIVRDSDQVAVTDNNVEGIIRVNRNISATVSKNSSEVAIRCISNTDLDAAFNRAEGTVPRSIPNRSAASRWLKPS
jgi:hypothetical protein